MAGSQKGGGVFAPRSLLLPTWDQRALRFIAARVMERPIECEFKGWRVYDVRIFRQEWKARGKRHLCRKLAGVAAFDSLGNCGDVFRGVPAATARNIDEATVGEF